MLTDEQVHEAIKQAVIHCRLLEQTDYHSVSLRGVLYELGYEADADQVIAFVAEGGFTYCLDPSVAATHYDPNNPQAVSGMVTDYPGEFACYWGPDQLRSRLQSLSNVPYQVRLAQP